MGVPTFCPIHMKIHECPENSNKAISSANETKIKAKMARMLNPTTTTESEKTQQAEKGTIQYILENAKKNNSTIKNKLGIESEEGRSVGIDENDIKAKMARLRVSVNGTQSTTNSESTSPTPNQQGSGLQEIIDHAYRVNRGIERIKSPEKEKLTAAAINFDDIDLKQLNEVMQEEQEKKVVSGTSKTKTATNRTKTTKNGSKKTISTTKKPKPKTTNANSTNKTNNKTVVLTTDEIEDLIEKAVIKAMAKEKDNKKKRGS
ncbi:MULTISPECIES: hypothetical protein [Spiroplasma]|uniref:hypothetical protein n=1 Tax=Spiroplasma TaxID=2132 RepID=UPI0018DD2CDC|nr:MULTISPECIES: hypothetical protein [Spiroplasma]MBH8622916.1 hypothetical protein [Spiroplasma sp. hyd1]UNF62074.1 hypothetical protein MNU24_01005 [Spiroplasma poulsonii]